MVDLRSLFEAKSVVVVGVSNDPAKQGRVVLRNLINGGFAGDVFGVGRNSGSFEGVQCVKSVGDLPRSLDLAFLAVPADAVVGNVSALAAAGVKSAIVGAAGFAESANGAGADRQSELQSIARQTGIRIVGPNCNGIYNTHAKLSVGFNSAHSRQLKPGTIAIISHSGALFDTMVAQIERLGGGLSIFVSAGNEADLDGLDYLEYALANRETRVIAILLDSLSDGPRFRALAQKAHAAGKHIVVLHVGTSKVGAEAAIAHSSRLAGNPEAYGALFRESNVPAVSSIEGLMVASVMLSAYGTVDGGLAALSSSGAGAALLADIAQRLRIRVPPFQQKTQRRLGDLLSFSQASNPLDLGIFPPHAEDDVTSIVAADPGIGALVALTQSFHGRAKHPVLRSIVEARRTSGKPVIVVSPGGFPEEERLAYEAGGVPVFSHTETALEGMAAILRPARHVDVEQIEGPPVQLGHDSVFDEPDSLEVLAQYGVPVVPTRRAGNESDVIEAAESIGWPVVLKGVVQGLAHKTEHSLVHVGLKDHAELVSAYRMLGCVDAIVQPMVKGKLELIAGVTRVQRLGLFLLAGLGGIFAEALDDVLLWPIPTPVARIRERLADSTIGRIVQSPRWNDEKSFDAFVELLNKLQAFANGAGNSLAAVDINPVILGDGRAVAVDATVVPAKGEKANV